MERELNVGVICTKSLKKDGIEFIEGKEYCIIFEYEKAYLLLDENGKEVYFVKWYMKENFDVTPLKELGLEC